MTDDPNARPTLSERYGVAVGKGTSMDHMILAAGLQHESLGLMLLRLQSEYGNIRGELERAGQIEPDRKAEAAELLKRAALAKRLKDYGAAELLTQRAAEIRSRTTAEVLTARALILMGLQSLHGTKQRFGALAIGMAMQPKRGIKADIARAIAGQVLDVWLDPTCHTCDGTGHIGSIYAGEQRATCRPCAGSGSRRDIVGKNPNERIFARDLFAEIQRRTAVAAGGMGHALAPLEA